MIVDRHKARAVVTPEGIALPFEVGSPVDRATAFLIDVVLIHVVVLAIWLFCVFAMYLAGGMAASIALLSSFILRTFYFTFFEIRWGGTTPGKRQLGLRAISRNGGPVTAEAVFARNLTREIEVFLPFAALATPDALLPGLPGWAALLGTGWVLLFALMPFFGRDHLRVGDMLAGTMVVYTPEAKLLDDLAEPNPLTGQRYHFTREQLDLYGIKELQVLEDLLRRSGGYREMELIQTVAGRIKKKIEWTDSAGPDRDHEASENADEAWLFLNEFYAAQRARLENKMLLGKRQQEKTQ